MTGRVKDVAAVAGVSISTASRVLRGISVEPELERRVKKAAQHLGYRPNGLAQALRGGRLGVIGLLIPDVRNPWSSDLARAVETVCRQSGLGVILCNSDNRPEQEDACLELLWNRRVDGLLLGSVRGEPPAQLADLVGRRWPVVALDDSCRGPGIDIVICDNHRGASLMAEHLAVHHRYRRIGLIKGPPKLASAEARETAFVTALPSLGARVVAEAAGDFTYEAGRAGMSEILAKRPDVQAVMATNDLMALGAIQACRDNGLKVPDDIAIVGFDDASISTLSGIGLTTVRQDLGDIAAACVTLLEDRIRDPGPARRQVCAVHLQIRSSCGCPTPHAQMKVSS
jgi:DNA-binding LacI/PurR family transcriptional regulator